MRAQALPDYFSAVASPFGSPLRALVRTLVLNYMPEEMKKWLKVALPAARRYVLGVLGAQAPLDELRHQLERQKSKVSHLEGRLAFSIHGLTLPFLQSSDFKPVEKPSTLE